MQANTVDRGDPNGPGDDLFDLVEFVVQRFVRVDDLLAVIVKHLPLASQAEALFAALDEQGLKQPLQRADLLADRRLGDLVNLRGLGKTLSLGQIAEYFKALDLHKRYKYTVTSSESTNVLLKYL